MKIIIIGAGIAGCAAYLELRKHLQQPDGCNEPHEIRIYEAYDTSADIAVGEILEEHSHSSKILVGGGLGITSNGLNVLRRLDEELLLDVVRGGYVTATSNMKSKDGWSLFSLPNNSSTKSDEISYTVATSRHQFWKALRRRIPDDHIIHKRTSRVVARRNGRNLVCFSDGTPAVEADLVIGADGVRSTVKAALFPDADEDPYPPRYEGLVGVGGFIPSAIVKGLVQPGSMNFICGGNGFFGYFFSESATNDINRNSPYHLSEPGESLAWWSTYEIKECPDRNALDMDDVTRQLRERHEHWKEPVVQKIIHSLHVENMYPTWTSPALPTWERDGVILVGDAAHALPPSSGQGSSQALEDVEALVLFLSRQLRKAKAKGDRETSESLKATIKTAATQYVRLRQPHVEEILKFSRKTQNNKRQMGLFQEYAMYAVLKIMGLFPSLVAKQMRKVKEYNVAEAALQVIASEYEID